jgi:indoleamine 2,3-dioxygenase
VEVAGAQALWNLQCILLEIANDCPNLDIIREHLAQTHASLAHMLSILKQAGKMDSELFYWQIRPYFAGWRNVLPDGVHYAGVDADATRRSYVGISAAQSSLFQALDAIFEIEHEEPGATYLRKMLAYMPRPHANFLIRLKAQPVLGLKDFVRQHDELREMFNRCISCRADFRAVHLSQVQKYAVQESFRKGKHAFGLAKPMAAGGGMHGAGATPIRLFLGSTLRRTKEGRLSDGRGDGHGTAAK